MNTFICPCCGAKGIAPGVFPCHCFNPILMGLIKIGEKSYVFRNDVGVPNEFWAWDIHDGSIRGVTHKWGQLPRGEVHLFDVDNPPETVGYIPILS
jgi:hypothetical protein